VLLTGEDALTLAVPPDHVELIAWALVNGRVAVALR
jgi:hypothetical protein